MAVIVDNDTKLVVQGLTGREGSFHGVRNRDYGTNVVAGFTAIALTLRTLRYNRALSTAERAPET